ncbi:glycosyl transferase, family 2 [Burkholderia multivorans ATCC 17616]|nr:glycosyl transferase, family 2 [Burkholderia multivorans ATCC 17616]
MLYHHESISRGKDETPIQRHRFRSEVSYMKKRWAHLMHHDPYYNVNLNYLQPDFSLSAIPHAPRPWRN